ncbi:tryptophan synthase subunit alpha [Parashewanella curva]|uniref:Tryptophan synthase alpha chain n=1 Tax=Parashewanella curva TaxID=2338552 RepID=A0A3L8Q0B6_9GAMM|nr:tryptophan synthase subunit alpha [Parashewanella curva]RLV61107.1 tryptophan synthase subunit alpha [Parashewanella curva]
MSQTRYQKVFEDLKAKQQGAFVPFVTIGDPNLEQSYKIIQTLIESGADALELGLPFSDPLADGPVIQAANIRALNSDVTPTACFELLAKVRQNYPDTPIGLLTYANLVYSNGIENFYTNCQQAGVDSVLIADVPVEESAEFREIAKAHDIAPIFIAPPNANDDLLKQVSELGEGYTYLLSRAGVTGTETQAGMPIEHILSSLKRHNAPPAILGFGISTPEQVSQAINSGAEGAISGSAVVKIIEANLKDNNKMLTKLGNFIKSMKVATY